MKHPSPLLLALLALLFISAYEETFGTRIIRLGPSHFSASDNPSHIEARLLHK